MFKKKLAQKVLNKNKRRSEHDIIQTKIERHAGAELVYLKRLASRISG